jgi:hypothetical protein
VVAGVQPVPEAHQDPRPREAECNDQISARLQALRAATHRAHELASDLRAGRQRTRMMTTRARVLLTAAGLVLIVLIFWLDQLTVSRIGFALLYVLPVAAAGWFLGLVPSIVLAVVTTIGWFLADQSCWGWETPVIGAWNAVTRLIIFGTLGAGAARLRLERTADNEMYRAKRTGKNRVSVWSDT